MEYFGDIIGQEIAKKLLASAIKNKKISHGYLFIGPANLGKFKFAIEFAKILQCPSRASGEAESGCERCAKIENGADPDVLLLDPISGASQNKKDEKKTAITIDDIRRLEHHLSLFPYYSKNKIVVINEADKFTLEAVNAFLKTLEEPKGNSVIILVAENIRALPRTLVSRAQIIRFSPVKDEIIRSFLAKEGASGEEAEKIAIIAEGRPGIAISLRQNSEAVRNYYREIENFKNFMAGKLEDKMAFLEDLAKDEKKIQDTLRLWLISARRELLAEYLPDNFFASGAPNRGKSGFGIAKMAKFVNNLSVILNLINTSNVNRRLALENLALEI